MEDDNDAEVDGAWLEGEMTEGAESEAWLEGKMTEGAESGAWLEGEMTEGAESGAWLESEMTEGAESGAWLKSEMTEGAESGAWLEGEMTEGAECDVYEQLAARERELQLAAELGKALLERNTELEAALATLGRRMEDLEQERHQLQSQVVQVRAESDSRARDLADDVSRLQEQLQQQESDSRQAERRQLAAATQLQLHSDTISEQLAQAVAAREALATEAECLRQQLTSRHSRHSSAVDSLEDEVRCLRLRRQQLEAEVGQVRSERDAVAADLEQLTDRLLALDKQRTLQDQELQLARTELEELRECNSVLQTQLDHVTYRRHSGHSPTLFSELSTLSQPGPLIQFHDGQTLNCLSADMLEDDDDFEYDDDIFCDVISHSSSVPDLGCHGDRGVQQELSFCRGAESYDVTADTGRGAGSKGHSGSVTYQPHFSMTSAVAAVQHDCSGQEERPVSDVEQRRYNSPSLHGQTDSDVIEMTPDSRHTDVLEMTPDAGHRDVSERTATPRHEDRDESREEAIIQRISEIYFRDVLQTLQSRLGALEFRVQELEGRVQELTSERDSLQSAACADVSVKQVLRQTREERDRAVCKVKEVEQELSCLTAEVVTLTGQLMAAIQRKSDVWQDLNQVDLSEVVTVQTHRRFGKPEEDETQGKPPFSVGGNPEGR